MDVIIELPDLLSKLKTISYSHYQLERVNEKLFITLANRLTATRYQIIEPISQAKQAEVEQLLNQYQSC